MPRQVLPVDVAHAFDRFAVDRADAVGHGREADHAVFLEDGLVHLLRHAAFVEHRADAVALEQAIHPLGVAEAGGGLERVDHVLAGR